MGLTNLLAQLQLHAEQRPDQAALSDGVIRLDYRGLLLEVRRLAATLPGHRVGLLLDNGVPWACLDLALLQRGSVCVPMPPFFSDAQLRHLIRDAGLDLVVCDRPERMAALLPGQTGTRFDVGGQPLWLYALHPAWEHVPIYSLPAATVKITYTSGTTGQPKGVCLSAEGIAAVTLGLCQAVAAGQDDRTLALLPLSTLLENIAGLYAPLLAGALAQLPSLARCGLQGSSGLQAEKLCAALAEYNPTTLVLVPQLLKAITASAAAGLPLPRALRFIAVGGAPLSLSLLEQARSLGLPVYQGYGLSEAGSVVSLNLPGAERPGSVGRPLPQHRVHIAEDGEIVVGEHLFLGYLGHAAKGSEPYRTGDLGHLDADGYLYLSGRKKTAYATAFGRNVAPEWVEGELTAHPLIAQAAVFGEGRPGNVAVLVGSAAASAIDMAVQTINARLPDYARVRHWLRAETAFSAANGQANAAGGLCREAVWAHYRSRIEPLFSREEHHAVS